MKVELINTEALISLGGNQGDVAETIAQAIERLDSLDRVTVTARSSNYLTQPVGVAAGEPFINAAVTIVTSFSPVELLNQLQYIENDLGRVRSLRWGPRTIDLDLILFGEQILETERLTLPHPACFYRRFVLDPSVEIAPNWRHPQFQLSINALRERLVPRPLQVSVYQDPQLLMQLQASSATGVEFNARPIEHTSIILDASGSLALPHAISLQGIEDRLAYTRQIMTAVTDTPQKI